MSNIFSDSYRQWQENGMMNAYSPNLKDSTNNFQSNIKTTTTPMLGKEENILEEANRLVSGDRQEAYSHPIHDYECTASMWSAMIKKRYGVTVPLTPDFCTLMMAAMKISREAGKHKRDNLVDLAGYARCTEMCLESKE